MQQNKTAVILFNLGGPDSPKAVRPFLINLFSDPAILQVPTIIRKILARVIAYRRTKKAIGIYSYLGGASPILTNTMIQSEAIEKKITSTSEIKVFIAMRYWHPMTVETIKNVKKYAPDKIILLPLYPHYSMTTSGSSIKAWNLVAKKFGLAIPTKTICCYPTAPKYIHELSQLIKNHLHSLKNKGKMRILFSAHGLPKSIIAKGDPYQFQIELTAAAVVAELKIPNLDWRVTYQSKVGPLEWLGPATDDEITMAGLEKTNLIICPIAFVSEHSETLVELDIDYRKLAMEARVPHYRRVETVGSGEFFIKSLCELINRAESSTCDILNHSDQRICSKKLVQCPYPHG
ncbi:MAG: ferrochelatase [Alphaproteobacteria bacterium]|nr:ferrochelatase [Alphaproteobacteria bacterium]